MTFTPGVDAPLIQAFRALERLSLEWKRSRDKKSPQTQNDEACSYRKSASTFAERVPGRFWFALVVLGTCVAVAAARADDARSPPDDQTQTLDGARATLDAANAALADPQASAATLKDLANSLRPLPAQLQGAIDALTPKIGATTARIAELSGQKKSGSETTPAPPPVPQAVPAVTKPPSAAAKKAKRAPSAPSPPSALPPPTATLAPAPEDAGGLARVQAELAEDAKLRDDLDANLKRARSLLVETGQVQSIVLERQRALFKRELFRRTNSLFSFKLWREVATDAPSAIDTGQYIYGRVEATFLERLRAGPPQLVYAVFALIAAFTLVGSILTNRFNARTAASSPTKIEKAARAAIVALTRMATPVCAIGATAAALNAFELVDPLAAPLLERTVNVFLLIVVCYSLARAVFAPSFPQWRLIDPGGSAASWRLTRLILFAAIALALSRLVEQVAVMTAARLPIVIANRGVTALVVALLLAVSLIRIRPPLTQKAEAKSGSEEREWFSYARYGALFVVALIFAACATGYVTLASFIVFVLAWLMMVIVSVRLLHALVCAGIDAAFDPKTKVGQLTADLLGREQLEPSSVLLAGLVTVLSACAFVLLALAPFGVESDAMLSNLTSSFYAISVAGVTISPAAAAGALALFSAILLATHGLRRWLDTRFLPLTRMDKGLCNSISASVNYLGVVIGVVVAFNYLGVGVERLAILAGALSVGVGFGLQSIVNNFVSGLILLWEGAIRVGDWIVVGDDQGHVKRINVRSTEIVTFDRATMIIPNSNLVSGSVKNWLRGDKVGRIKIAIAPDASVEPSRVEDILLAAAREQEGVLRIPAPQVMFLAMERDCFRFELWCYVEDVEQSARVRSDLHFDIYKRFVDANVPFGPPPAVTQVAVSDFELLVDAMSGVMRKTHEKREDKASA